MAFTDEQLASWKKDVLAGSEAAHLIARLEAAEYALLRMSIVSHMYTTGIDEAVEAWRKSKGGK